MSRMSKAHSGWLRRAAGIAGCVLLAGAGLRAGEAEPVGGTVESLPAAQLVQPPLTESEGALRELITSGFAADGAGRRAFGADPTVLSIRPNEAAEKALENNLALQVQYAEDRIRRAALQEARAVFLPVFDLSFTYNRHSTQDRFILEKALFGPFPKVNAGKDIPIPAPSKIKEIRVMTALDMLEDYYKPVYASKRPKSDPEDIFTWEAGISQQLPWGPQIFITNSLVKHHIRYDWKGHSYDADWTANLSAELLMPLPFTANFGPLAPSDVTLRSSKFDKERAYWDVRTVIDTTLLDASTLYWSLLNRAMILRDTLENRSAFGELARKTAELFEAERVTAYGKGQIDAELARLEAIEADAWSRYVQASAALAEYLDLPSGVLLVPVGWEAAFDNDAVDLQPDRAVETAVEANPALRAARVSLEQSELLEAFYRHQRRPAISADILTNFAQIGSTYGYKDPAVALQNLFDTDKRTTTYALEYTVPLGNVPARAAHQRARAEREETDLVLAETERAVVRQVRDAVATLAAARARVTLAAEKLRAAEQAYTNAVDLRGAGRIGEFEVVRRSQDLLSARYAWSTARIQREVAEADLLAATGTIASEFATMTAQTAFERYRLAVLRAAGILQFF